MTTKAEINKEVSIQPALPLDAKKIWKIYKAGRIASQTCAELDISGSEVWEHILGDGTVGDQIAQWEQRIFHPSADQQVLVALQKPNDKVVGVVWPNIVDQTRYLNKLYVAKQFQGLGIGSKLIDATKTWHQFEPITLKVAAYNHLAQALYESHGFEVVEEIPCGYTINNKPVPQKIMTYPGHQRHLSVAPWPADLTF